MHHPKSSFPVTRPCCHLHCWNKPNIITATTEVQGPRTPGLISARQYWLTTVLPGRIFPYRTCTLDYSGMFAVSIFLPCLLQSPSLVIKAFLWKHSTSCLFGHAGNSEIVLQQARCKQHPQGDPFPSPVPGSSSLTLPQAEGSCGDGPRNRPGHHIQHQKTPG